MTEPFACVKAIRAPFFAASLATGRPIAELAAELDLAVALLSDTTARVPHALVVRVWEAFAARLANPTFGLTAAAIVGIPRVDAIDYALQRSATVRELIDRFLRYQRLFHDANASTVHVGPAQVEIRQGFPAELPRSRHFTEFILAMWIGRLRSLLPGVDVRHVMFRHAAPADLSAHTRAFGDAVVFDAAHDGIAVAPSLLDSALREADPDVARMVEVELDRELAALGRPTTLAGEVRHAIARMLRGGEACEIDTVAHHLAVSPRTLQRRLGEEGASFRELLDDARRDHAVHALRQPGASLTDLAFLLGFSEVSAFSRAFRRWVGKSPTEFVRGSD